MKFKRQLREEVSVNLTPLIDVVFLLLIFFMVSTNFIDNQKLDLTLPEASAKSKAESESIQIGIDKNGQLFLGKTMLKDTKRETLTEALKQELVGMKAQQQPVELNADHKAEHGLVVMVLDVAAELGLVNVRIKTQALK